MAGWMRSASRTTHAHTLHSGIQQTHSRSMEHVGQQRNHLTQQQVRVACSSSQPDASAQVHMHACSTRCACEPRHRPRCDGEVSAHRAGMPSSCSYAHRACQKPSFGCTTERRARQCSRACCALQPLARMR